MLPNIENLVISSVGETFLLGAHDVENCQESEGCVEVEIIVVWTHENFVRMGSIHNDIAVVK